MQDNTFNDSFGVCVGRDAAHKPMEATSRPNISSPGNNMTVENGTMIVTGSGDSFPVTNGSSSSGINTTNPPASGGETDFVSPPTGPFDSEAFRGSMQQMLSDNLGQFVVIDFLIGTETLDTRQGILYSVGRAYVTLFEEISRTYIVCDIFSVKFVTFYEPGQRPVSNNANYYNNRMPANNRTNSNRGFTR